jgi:hypothetical protein
MATQVIPMFGKDKQQEHEAKIKCTAVIQLDAQKPTVEFGKCRESHNREKSVTVRSIYMYKETVP